MLTTANLRALRLLTIVLPLLFLSIYYYLMLKPAHTLFHSLTGFLVLMAVLGILVTVFANAVFGVIERQQETILDQNRELAELGKRLRSLYHAGTQLVAEVDLQAVQRRIVELSRGLLEARFAALAMVDDGGTLTELVSAGPEGVAWNPNLGFPVDLRILQEALDSGRPLRRQGDLYVPVRYKGRPMGALLLGNPSIAREFSDMDQDLIQLFASQAGVALENARLYREVQVLATETERVRIAREMHDNLAQVLAYVNTKAQAVDELLDQGRTAEARQHLGQLVEAARKVYADVREGILGLRAQITPERNLLRVLDEYIKEFTSQCGIQTRLRVDGDNLGLDSMQEIQVLRIVQEALTNVRRHSGARSAEVHFARTGTSLRIVVTDDGRGIRQSRGARTDGPHFGLQTMRERAESIGGTFHIEENPGGGTRVVVNLPVRQPPPATAR